MYVWVLHQNHMDGIITWIWQFKYVTNFDSGSDDY